MTFTGLTTSSSIGSALKEELINPIQDLSSPEVVSSSTSLDGTSLTINFTEQLACLNSEQLNELTSSFTLSIDGTPFSGTDWIESINISEDQLIFHVTDDKVFKPNEVVFVVYKKGADISTDITDLSGNSLRGFTRATTNNSTITEQVSTNSIVDGLNEEDEVQGNNSSDQIIVLEPTNQVVLETEVLTQPIQLTNGNFEIINPIIGPPQIIEPIESAESVETIEFIELGGTIESVEPIEVFDTIDLQPIIEPLFQVSSNVDSLTGKNIANGSYLERQFFRADTKNDKFSFKGIGESDDYIFRIADSNDLLAEDAITGSKYSIALVEDSNSFMDAFEAGDYVLSEEFGVQDGCRTFVTMDQSSVEEFKTTTESNKYKALLLNSETMDIDMVRSVGSLSKETSDNFERRLDSWGGIASFNSFGSDSLLNINSSVIDTIIPENTIIF